MGCEETRHHGDAASILSWSCCRLAGAPSKAVIRGYGDACERSLVLEKPFRSGGPFTRGPIHVTENRRDGSAREIQSECRTTLLFRNASKRTLIRQRVHALVERSQRSAQTAVVVSCLRPTTRNIGYQVHFVPRQRLGWCDPTTGCSLLALPLGRRSGNERPGREA